MRGTDSRAPEARQAGFDIPAQVGPLPPAADPDDFAGGPTARGALPLETRVEVAAHEPPPMWWPWIGVFVCLVLLAAARWGGHPIATPLVVLGWGALVAIPMVAATWWSRYDERTFPDVHERTTTSTQQLERRVLIDDLWGISGLCADGATVIEDYWAGTVIAIGRSPQDGLPRMYALGRESLLDGELLGRVLRRSVPAPAPQRVHVPLPDAIDLAAPVPATVDPTLPALPPAATGHGPVQKVDEQAQRPLTYQR
jgi:hypothetical protein